MSSCSFGCCVDICIYIYNSYFLKMFTELLWTVAHICNKFYIIRKSMLFPLLWYVDGCCTIKIVEMADRSLYALKLWNNAHFLFYISLVQKKKHTKYKMRLSRLSVVRLWRESCCKSQIAVANRTTSLKVIWKKIGDVRVRQSQN